MSKKTINQLKKEINKLIRFGHSASLIKTIMFEDVSEVDYPRNVLDSLIKDVVDEHPSYPLIQKIVRSKLVVDKCNKDDIIYILDPMSLKIDLISKSRLNELFFRTDFSSKTYVCDFEYSPDVMKRLFQSEEGLWQYNLYIAPKWLEDNFNSEGDIEIEKTELPEVYKTFLNHLVDNDEASYEYVLDWLAKAIQGRNYTILTTIGNQGIGKGVLGEIMRQVVGDKNFYKTESRLLTKDFNKQILNKKLVYIDELKLKNTSEENKIKTLVNDYIEIEGKGVDAVEVKNYASIYVSSNDFDAIRLRGDDRRFSIIELTKKKLLKTMNEKEVSSLLLLENISKFASFLYHRDLSGKNLSQVFISSRTAEVRESSLKAWEEFFIEDICTRGPNDIKMTDASNEIEDIHGSKCKPSKAAFKRLQELYPDKFGVVRKSVDKKRIWFITFPEQMN